MPTSKETSLRKLWAEFLPLSLSDVFMALSDPLITTTLAHLPEARLNLAAIGLAKPVVVFFESPVIMLLHASNVLSVRDGAPKALWRFSMILVSSLSVLLLFLTVPPIYSAFGKNVLGVGGELLVRSQWALFIMFLWPFSSGWRRYFQGILIRRGHNSDIALASTGRLLVACLILYSGFHFKVPGYLLAAFTLIGTIVFEAILVTWFASKRQTPASTGQGKIYTVRDIARFYFPLANTMVVVWGSRALLIAVIARAADKQIALAAWPAAWGLVVLLANSTRMVQQVVIRHRSQVAESLLLKFALSVGLVGSVFLILLCNTGLGNQLLGIFLGNDLELLAHVRPVVVVCSIVPLLVALQNAIQGLLISEGLTQRVSNAAWMGGISLIFVAALGISLEMEGAFVAAVAMLGTSLSSVEI